MINNVYNLEEGVGWLLKGYYGMVFWYLIDEHKLIAETFYRIFYGIKNFTESQTLRIKNFLQNQKYPPILACVIS